MIAGQRDITYLSAPAPVSMGDHWFGVVAQDHFWIQRRFQVFQRLAGNLIANCREPAEIGCGHGLVQRQVEEVYGVKVTGFDLNESALKQNVSRVSPLCCYDIFQKNPELKARFDLIFLFDVLEHIDDEDQFLSAVLFHLAPGGKLVLNVPANQWLYSAYDRAVGHKRRYTTGGLRLVAQRNGLAVVTQSYWGLPLIPVLALRRLWLLGKTDADRIISAGMDSRTPLINQLMGLACRLETIPQTFLGTSLMAVLAPQKAGVLQ